MNLLQDCICDKTVLYMIHKKCKTMKGKEKENPLAPFKVKKIRS